VRKLLALVGLTVAVAGTALVLEQVHTAHAFLHAILSWAPVVLILIGLVRLLSLLGVNWDVLGPAAILTTGLILLAIDKGILTLRLLKGLVPGGMILVGSGVVMLAVSEQNSFSLKPSFFALALLGRRRVEGRSPDLQHVRAVVLFGRLHLDLSQSDTSGGTHVHTWVVFGSLHVSLPSDYPYRHQVRFSYPPVITPLVVNQKDPVFHVDDIRIFGETTVYPELSSLVATSPTGVSQS
jgi:hypothetical protein